MNPLWRSLKKDRNFLESWKQMVEQCVHSCRHFDGGLIQGHQGMCPLKRTPALFRVSLAQHSQAPGNGAQTINYRPVPAFCVFPCSRLHVCLKPKDLLPAIFSTLTNSASILSPGASTTRPPCSSINSLISLLLSSRF